MNKKTAGCVEQSGQRTQMFGLHVTDKDKMEFEDLLMPHLGAMYGFAYHLTMNEQEARDLVQEASLRAWRFFGRFERGTNFKGWVLTILRNIFINDYRRRKARPRKVHVEDFENIAGTTEDFDPESSPDEAFGESLQKHVESLPDEMRETVVLFYTEGLSYKEIAGVMNCPAGTVMSRLFQAKKLLKRKLSKSVRP